ncbi:beta-propeller domain-containing protein [Brevibacillus choshinensis]|uniref:beta-propeller domain-containing protein n=1 Tax=Brevibacillus choshinensis TaxID=54911 RepID=UPI002E219B49|nr:beta-propeller domain-containing protein [Brevibacillus choshinensis]
MKKGWSMLLISTALTLALTPFFTATGAMGEENVTNNKDELPVVGSYDHFKKLLETEWRAQQNRNYPTAMESTVVMSQAAPQAKMADSAGGTPSDFSTTNTQVQGVDEADIVKSDGTYLYQATNQEVRIIQAYPAAKMQINSRITYDNGLFQPLELYVDEKRLIVIGQASESVKTNSSIVSKRRIPYVHEQQTTKAMIYDITDKANPRLTRQLDIEGQYLSSRKIGANLYVTANQYVNTYRIFEDKETLPGPLYRDSLEGDQYQSVPYSDIRYFPKSIQPDFLMVAGVNLDRPKQKMSLGTYLGAGENIYASPENLYVAVTEYEAQPETVKPMGQSFAPTLLPVPTKTNTTIYRFGMAEGVLTFSGKGTVPGRILNQFSLDEHDGYLRIATTSGEMWRNDENTSKNNLYVLDQELHTYGKLEGIAPGERIYSARFMGNRAYMVTFKQVDPLFVIDLAKPSAPSILGALKIPGYSDYLHPYDENHIIGFGKEAESDKDMAFYQGMKVALFDVSDVTHPKEKFKTVIGDRGTNSDLLSNHKALLFSKEKELLAFPVTVYEWTTEQKAKNDIHEYGSFTFQGAYVYQLNLKTGFTLNSKITHLTEQDLKKSGDGWYNSKNNINRILTINDTLYTVSEGFIAAQQLSSKRQLGILPLAK